MMRMLPKVVFAVAAAGALAGCRPDRPRDIISFSNLDRALVVHQARYGSYPARTVVPGGVVYSRQVRSGYYGIGGGGTYIYSGYGAPVYSGSVVLGYPGSYGYGFGRGYIRIGGRPHGTGSHSGGHTGGRTGGRTGGHSGGHSGSRSGSHSGGRSGGRRR